MRLPRDLDDAEDRRAQLLAAKRAHGPDARELREDWPNLTLEQQRKILRAGIDAVLVRRVLGTGSRPPVRERIRVVFVGEDVPEGLLDGGRSGPVRTWTWNGHPGAPVALA